MKKIIILPILLFFYGCSFFLSANELGSAKLYPQSLSFATNTIERPTLATEIVRPIAMASETPSSMEDSHLITHSGPGKVNAPILLYHHILIGKPPDPYSVSIERFQEQLSYLKDYGYQSISVSKLIQAITVGADLPEKPIIFTFDDGNENVYSNAFPLMKKFGFTGTVYIIANRIDVEGFFTKEQIKDLLSAGWEVGSHGMKHIDLVIDPGALRDEIGNSKKIIEDMLDLKLTSFAYPYGKATKITMDWVRQIGYLAGMGLGISNQHDKEDLFYLSRRQVESNMDIHAFTKLLSIN